MSTYYTHQHSQNQGDGDVVQVSSLYTVAPGAGGVEHATEGVELAKGNQLAAYKAPARRGKDSPGRALCASEGCKAYPMKTLEYCSGHARSLGLIDSWKKAGRGDAG